MEEVAVVIDFIISCLAIIVAIYIVFTITFIVQTIILAYPSKSFIELIACTLWPFVVIVMIISIIRSKMGWHCSD